MSVRPDRLCAAVAQMCSGPDLMKNLEQAEELIIQAKLAGAELVVLPENFALFGASDLWTLAESPQRVGPISHFLQRMSQQHQIWVVAGTYPGAHSALSMQAAEPKKVYAQSAVWSPEGICVARYDKCHLFDVDVADGVGRYRESDTFCVGEGPQVVATPWGGLGLSVCYDLRFPEYFRRLVELGAVMMTVPSAFTYLTGEAHWEVLLRARAIENQCFVLAANQGGEHQAGRKTWGHSCIIDSWGTVLACRTESGPGVVVADLDLRQMENVRRKMPVKQHRRF